MLKPGDMAPEFCLPTADGGTVSLHDLKGRKVVLYFYPKDNTSGCTKEACAFRDQYASLKRKGVEVIGMSADSVASHRKFAEKNGLPFILASDKERAVIRAYGVWKEKSMYGRSYYGIERSTFVISETGTLLAVFRKVKVEGHVEEVAKFL